MTILNKINIDPSDITGVINALITATESVSPAVTAATDGTQTSATQLTAYINHISTAAALYSSVKLPAATFGTDIVVINSGAYPIAIFPQTGEFINDTTHNTPMYLSVGGVAYFVSHANGYWHTNASAASPFSVGVTDNIVASSTGTQSGATQLYSHINKVTTAAGNNYSVILPVLGGVGVYGGDLFVINASAHAINVFPPVGGAIDQYGTNAGLSVAMNATTHFVTVGGNLWYSVH